MTRTEPSLVPDAEFPMTERDFLKIARIVESAAGIEMPRGNATMVYARLSKRLRALRLRDFAAYCALVESTAGQGERQTLIQKLTTNLTHFFREPHHFEHLKTIILPPLIAKLQQGGKARFWSAGCSSGQEPYSIALTVLSLLPDAEKFDIRILATDLDKTMLATGAAGIYGADALAPVPPELTRWFTPLRDAPGSFRASDTLRKLVAFRELNLMGEWPMRCRFNAIFCRNVVIYFNAETQSRVWSRIGPMVAGGGALYLGHSERLCGPAERMLHSDGVTTYRNFAQGDE